MQISISEKPNNIFAKFAKRQACQSNLIQLTDECQVRGGLKQKLSNIWRESLWRLSNEQSDAEYDPFNCQEKNSLFKQRNDCLFSTPVATCLG